MHSGGRDLPDRESLARIVMLLTDVDGVLTDGRLQFDAAGQEFKSFHVHDSAGLVFWNRAGLLSGFVSGRGGKVVEDHARELGVHEVHLGSLDKATVFAGILKRHGLTTAQCAFVGDDLLDLPVMRGVGLAASVPAGRAEVHAVAHYVTATEGGFGAVREVIELLLRAKGRWDEVVAKDGLP